MKKTLLPLCFLLLISGFVFAQSSTNSEPTEKVSWWPDITSILIGLVLGAAITHFATQKTAK